MVHIISISKKVGKEYNMLHMKLHEFLDQKIVFFGKNEQIHIYKQISYFR